jgi:hypothetical protein
MMSRSCVILAALFVVAAAGSTEANALEMLWKNNFLTIRGEGLPGGSIEIMYLEAYCRPGSTARDWHETVIGHKMRLVEATSDGKRIELECRLNDGVVVRHRITASADTVEFRVEAHNPTDRPSQAHWAQPCMRVDRFTGVEPARDSEKYLARSFVFLPSADGGEPVRTNLDTIRPWARGARYVPGQVWAGPGVPRNDVNPRPLSKVATANGLIGCVSADGRKLLATAWEPYQELFQGVVVCLHSDFRIGGLAPGETKSIRGMIYVIENDTAELLSRYRKDFPASGDRKPD